MVAPGAPLGTTTGVAHDALSIVSEDVVDGVGETSACKTSAIVEQVVALARGMALPGTYVGQAAFLLLALKQRMRVHLWIGARRVDIIEDYAPWAKSFCQIEAHADAILSKVTVDETTGSAQMHRVIDHGSVNDANHWEACIPCGHPDEGAGAIGHLDEGAGAIVDVETENEDMVGYYMSRGRVVVHTVRDGNCAFDAMCVMVGMPRTDATIWDMRFEVADFLMSHAENAALHRALKSCCEVDLPIDPWDNLAEHNAPLLFRDDDLEASDDDATPAIAGCVDARAFPDSVLDAVAWASGIRQCSREKALGLCRALPNWCIDEQVKKYNARPTSSKPTPINKSIAGKHEHEFVAGISPARGGRLCHILENTRPPRWREIAPRYLLQVFEDQPRLSEKAQDLYRQGLLSQMGHACCQPGANARCKSRGWSAKKDHSRLRGP